MTRFVLDASVALSWCFENQSTAYSEAVFEEMERGSVASVPFIWPLEISNALVIAERRKIVKVAQVRAFLEELQEWPIEVDAGGIGQSFGNILETARRRHLSAYDAAYLELAAREGFPIATLDNSLRRAASAEGVEIARP